MNATILYILSSGARPERNQPVPVATAASGCFVAPRPTESET